MEEYPEELRTPPVGVVALVGCTHHQHLITYQMQSEQPPINTLALPDLSSLSLLLHSSSSSSSSKKLASSDPLSSSNSIGGSAAAGILKRDWLLKHRTRVPAVVAPLFSSDQLSADPSIWLNVTSLLDSLKSLIRPKNIKLAIIVVLNSQSMGVASLDQVGILADDVINEDLLIALRKRAEVDSKYLLVLNPNDHSQLKRSLSRIGSSFAELANAYYRDEGRRIKTRVEKKSFNSPELNVRYCFKVAVYAEFRRDWAEALRYYEDAYHTLREMVGTTNRLPAIQRLVQIKTVAEQLHFKISTLLLHGGKVIEALSWFRQHNTSYKRLVGAPQVTFLHSEWMSRQFLVFAELLETSLNNIPGNLNPASGLYDKSFTEWEFQPAFYYQLAAHYQKEKRNSLDHAISVSETAYQGDSAAESVVPSIYVGQFARLLEQGDEVDMQSLTDEEFTLYAISEGKRFEDAFEIIALLKRSCQSFSNLKMQRMASLCRFKMAKEYFSVGDFGNAKELLDTVASLYRNEGWVTLLWEVLGYLRECSRRCGTVKEFIEYSLEMAALPVSSETHALSSMSKEYSPAGPATLARRETIHREVFGLVNGDMGLASAENGGLKIIGDNPLHIEVDLVSPLRLVLLASVAFHEQIIKPGVPALVTLSLLSQLPHTVDIDQIEVQFNQSECNFTIMNSQKSPSDAPSTGQQGHRVESAASLALVTNKWLRLTYSIRSELSGKLECLYIVAKMGSRLAISCRVESPASMDDLPLWKFEDRVETFPTKDPVLAFFGQKAAQVEELDPQVDLILGAIGPALIGECFMVPVTVIAKWHSIFSGELKINLVDVRGGGLFSPREAEPFSLDSHHVKLLGVNASVQDESNVAPDDIKKIQESFGLVSVPNLKLGDSWSCHLEIKWHRPKPIMLFVSLGYFSDSNELTSQKVHVHKSLQIDGKTAIQIGHYFMLPFRQDPLLLSRTKSASDSDQLVSLPVNETSILIVSAKNLSGVPLQLQSISIDVDDVTGKFCKLQHCDEHHLSLADIVPGEEFKKVFTVTPLVESPNLNVGSVVVRWRRNSETTVQSSALSDAWVLTKHELPDVKVEVPPLIVVLECPPYATLGDDFAYLVRIRNQTKLLQEVKFSLADAPSFVVSGSHSDTVYILPKSEHVIGYKIVPLASGLQQLPRVTVTSVRYSAVFQPSVSESTVFVFPSKSLRKTAEMGEKGIKSLVAE